MWASPLTVGPSEAELERQSWRGRAESCWWWAQPQPGCERRGGGERGSVLRRYLTSTTPPMEGPRDCGACATSDLRTGWTASLGDGDRSTARRQVLALSACSLLELSLRPSEAARACPALWRGVQACSGDGATTSRQTRARPQGAAGTEPQGAAGTEPRDTVGPGWLAVRESRRVWVGGPGGGCFRQGCREGAE